MVGWHHQLNGHEFEHAPADGEGQGSLVCCRTWGREESDMIERLNHTTSAIKRNAFESVFVRRMNLDTVVQSEVSRKEEHQYINAYIWNLEKRY